MKLGFRRNLELAVELLAFLTVAAAGLASAWYRVSAKKDWYSAVDTGLLTTLIIAWWSDRKKIRNQLDETTQAIQDRLNRVIQNSDLLNALTSLDKVNSEIVLARAKHHIDISNMKDTMTPRFHKVSSELIEEHQLQLKYLSRSGLNFPMRDVAYANSCVLSKFKNMHAVSDRAIHSFWRGGLGDEYHRTIVKSAGSKTHHESVITRIFILDLKRDLDDKVIDETLAVVGEQMQDGVEVAIAFFSQDIINIEEKIKQANVLRAQATIPALFLAKLDFALFDGGSNGDGDRAVSFFSDDHKNELNHRFMAAFSTADPEHENNKLITLQRQVWIDLLCECWIASPRFFEKLQLPASERDDVIARTGELNRRLKDKVDFTVEDRVFPLLVRHSNELRNKLGEAKRMHLAKQSNTPC